MIRGDFRGESSLKGAALPTRIEDKFIPEPNSGCWLWTASSAGRGYGVFRLNKQMHYAHRWIYERLVGPIPDGLVIDHKCRVTFCVNPAHLEPVSNLENIRRGQAGAIERARTHCPKGHPYEGDNLIAVKTQRGTPARQCRTCHRAAVRKSGMRRRGLS